MAIPLPGPDRLPPGPTRDLVVALHQLYDEAGRPGARTISLLIRRDDECPDTVSHETVTAMLRGPKVVPRWDKVESVVRVLSKRSIRKPDVAQELSRFHRLWLAAQSAGPRPAGTPMTQPPPGFAVPPPAGPAAATTRPVRTGGGTVPAAPANAPPAQPDVPGSPVTNAPPPESTFTGRGALLTGISEQLRADTTLPVVLYGVAGVGKTRLALEYLHRAPGYDLVWWVPAEDAERARTSLADLGERLRVPRHDDLQQTVRAVLTELETRLRNWLLVFDNVSDAGVRGLLPRIGGSTIMTTRNPDLADEFHGIEVLPFEREESLQFLREHAAPPDADAAQLCVRLGDLPLALVLLAAVQATTGESWSQLSATFDQHLASRLTAGRGDEPSATVSALLLPALQRLRTESPTASQLFELFAHLGPEPVGVTLLRRGRGSTVTAPLAWALDDPVRMSLAIAELARYGLIKVYPGQRIEVQPLVRLAMRQLLEDEARRRSMANVHEILSRADPGWPDELPSLDLHIEIAPHVLDAQLIESRDVRARRTVYNQVRYRYLNGDHDGAARLAERAVQAWSQAPPSVDPAESEYLLFATTRELANALRARGRHAESGELTRDTIARLEQQPGYGGAHPLTLAMRAGEGADKRFAGAYREALQIDQENLRAHKSAYGEGDARTARAANNVAVNHRLLGNFEAARELDDRVSKISKARGLPELTALAAANLARDLYGLGRYQEAIEQQRRLAAEHQDTRGRTQAQMGDRTVAMALRALGEYAAARELAKSHYEHCNRLFGAAHEYTLAATLTYANALRDAGEVELAHDHAVDAVASYRDWLGTLNPLTLAAEVDLAVVLRARGDRHRARRADQMAFDNLCQVVGARHPFALCAAVGLANDRASDGDFVGAGQLSEQAWARAKELYGPDHLVTLGIAVDVALDRTATEGAAAADELRMATLGAMRKHLGPTHPQLRRAEIGHRIDVDIEPFPL